MTKISQKANKVAKELMAFQVEQLIRKCISMFSSKEPIEVVMQSTIPELIQMLMDNGFEFNKSSFEDSYVLNIPKSTSSEVKQ